MRLWDYPSQRWVSPPTYCPRFACLYIGIEDMAVRSRQRSSDLTCNPFRTFHFAPFPNQLSLWLTKLILWLLDGSRLWAHLSPSHMASGEIDVIINCSPLMRGEVNVCDLRESLRIFQIDGVWTSCKCPAGVDLLSRSQFYSSPSLHAIFFVGIVAEVK